MLKEKKAKLILGLAIGLFLSNASFAATIKTKSNQSSVAKINALVAQKKYVAAYDLSQKLSTTESGDLAFDMAFGRAALGAQKLDVAAMAFERVLMSDEKNDEARLGLAYAYYRLKMYDQAKAEADIIKADLQNAHVGGAASALKNKIAHRRPSENFKYSFYGRVRAGHDDNANGVTDEDYSRFLDLTGTTFDLKHVSADAKPPYGEFWDDEQKAQFDVMWNEYLQSVEELDRQYTADQIIAQELLYDNLRKQGQKPESFYISPKMGMRVTYSPGSRYSLYLDANAEHKEYTKINGYDITQGNVSAGANFYINSSNAFDGNLYYQEYLFDGSRYRESPIIALGFSHLLNSNNILKIYTNDGILSYPSSHTQDVKMYLGGLEWLCFNRDQTNILIAQGFYGRYQPKNDAAKYNGNNYYGLDVSAAHRFTPKLKMTVGATYQNFMYDEKEFINAGKRHDSYVQGSAGIYYLFHPSWTWYVNSAYTKNYSNIFIYKYNRTEIETGINVEL